MGNQAESNRPCPDGKVRGADGKCVMPEVSFSTFILSLNTSALFHMGELPHPETGEKAVDLELARHSIDTLRMLQDKTRGNLEEDEKELLDNILYELKLRYVKIAGD
ncbi:hypothetical protein GF1_13040 [Desulfolithobacter dissulfuricans]|uniref:DUF1844 domain-containing protein n=1 Tax=Desulfolithobacter dissulfuricans TaxID=2795293 RepID=A0A915U023_9BACT|nr:DUF1844 domain-containing protein [Desulfolithobacter dissulfuricans]BCO08928.1 hypothetical protein GF1_13040 [Desulfolithobacter dissulfuricans]